jgi:hypothetical protein
MLTDVKYGLRLYRRAPAFSLGVVLTSIQNSFSTTLTPGSRA